MRRRPSFGVATAPEPIDPPRSWGLLHRIALAVVVFWAVCVGLAWAIAWIVRLFARVLA